MATQQVTPVATEVPAMAGSPGEQPLTTYAKKKVIFRTYQVIWYVLGLIEVLLAFRFVLKLLGASTASEFTQLIYNLTDPLVAPFRGIFPTPAMEGSVLEWYTLIAAVVYALVAYGLVHLFQLVKPTNPQEIEQNIET